MKTTKNHKSLDEIGFIGSQPKKHGAPEDEKKLAIKTRKAMDEFRKQHLGKKRAA